MYLLYSRERLRKKNHYGYVGIRDISPDPGLFGSNKAFIKLIDFLKLHRLSTKETYLFADISKGDLHLPTEQSISHLPEKQKVEVKKSVENILNDRFSQADIEMVLPYDTDFLSSICFSIDLSDEGAKKLQQSLDEYVQDFIDGGLVIAERNALIFERQKEQFFYLMLSTHLLEKYGQTFVLESNIKINSDFFYIHTLLALEKLGYIVLNQISFSGSGTTSEVEYKVNLKLKQAFIDEMHRKYQKDHPEAVYEKYDTASGTLYFLGKKIELSKSADSDAARLMNTLGRRISNNWNKDEILDDWGYSLDEQKNLPQQKIYQAAVRIQNAVAKKTQVDDFLIFSTKEVRVNPKYLTE